MTEYEEITEGYDIAKCKEEFKNQLNLGYKRSDSFPQFLLELIRSLEIKEGKTPFEPLKLTFLTIDFWGRAVFKDDNGNLFGNVDVLFDPNSTGEEVLNTLNENLIYYFGRNIDDDPQGIKIDPTKIYLCS